MSVALIVEDDRNSLEGYAELIRDEGFEALTAETLADARRLIREHTIDVAVLDLQLPDGEGTELLDDLSGQPNAEIVMITGHGSIDSAVEALHRGASDYLTKPVDIHRLRKILDKARNTIELRDQVLERVNRLYFERLRVRTRLGALGPDAPERGELEIRASELAAQLDAWTGGLFSRLERGIAPPSASSASPPWLGRTP